MLMTLMMLMMLMMLLTLLVVVMVLMLMVPQHGRRFCLNKRHPHKPLRRALLSAHLAHGDEFPRAAAGD